MRKLIAVGCLLSWAAHGQQISQMPAASSASAGDLIAATQGYAGLGTGTTRAITPKQIINTMASADVARALGFQPLSAGSIGGTIAPLVNGFVPIGNLPPVSALGGLVAGASLSDVASVSAARTNLGLGTASTLNVGATTGTVAAGDDSRIVGALQATSLNQPNGTAGLDGAGTASALSVLATGGLTPQTTADVAASNGIPLESFFRPPEADFTNALTRGIASGQPIKLAPKTYTVNGDILINNNFTLVGIPGISKIVATAALPTGANGTWFRLTAPIVNIDGVIFDQAGFGAAHNVQNFKTESTVTRLTVRNSSFRGASGTLPTGFWLNGDTTVSDNPSYIFQNVEFSGNGADGLRIQQAINVLVTNPQAHDNLGSGINVNYLVGSDTIPNKQIQILGGRAYNNTNSGVIIGNFLQVASTPPVYGNALTGAAYVVVSGMFNFNNGAYGIQAFNDYVLLNGNIVTGNAPGGTLNGGGGIEMTTRYSAAIGNLVANNGYYGLDMGGSLDTIVAGNRFYGCGACVNTGASVGASIRSNLFSLFTDKAINIPNVDSSGAGVAFPQITKDVTIDGNDFDMSAMSLSSYAVYAVDGVQNVNVMRNRWHFSKAAYDAGMRAGIGMLALTDNVNVDGNSVTLPIRNGAGDTQLTDGQVADADPAGVSNWVVIPDMLSNVRVNIANFTIGNISGNSSFNHSSGEISWVNVTTPGSGYSAATTTVSFSGLGTGASGVVYVWNGQVLGVAMITRGSGYTNTATATITDSGATPGTGAAATLQINTPIPRNRRIRVHASSSGTLQTTGTFTTQATPSGNNLYIQAGTSVDLAAQGGFLTNGAGGAWYVESVGSSTLSGASASLGGSALAAGACTSGTVTITGSTTAMAVSAAPVVYPGDGFVWNSYVSAPGVVTVKLCATAAGTPVASVYNVRVVQ